MFRRNFISCFTSSSSSLFRTTLPLLESSTGMVRQWKEGSRFGFITDDDSSDSLFVHRSNCIWADEHETHRCIAGGTRVAYDIVFDTRKGDGRKRCENVTLEDGSALPAGPYRDLDAGSASSGRSHNNDSSRSRGGGGNRKNDASSSSSSSSFHLVGKQDLHGTVRSTSATFGFIRYIERLSSNESVGRSNERVHSIFYHCADIISAEDAAAWERDNNNGKDSQQGNDDDEAKKNNNKKPSTTRTERKLPPNFQEGDDVVFDVEEDDRKKGVARAVNISLRNSQQKKQDKVGRDFEPF